MERTFYSLVILIALASIAVSSALPNTSDPPRRFTEPVPMPSPAPEKPPYTGYKGVTIGMTAENARAKLGTPKEKTDESDYFAISENEFVQIYYDASKTVTAMTVTFSGKIDGAPTAIAVFGEDAEVKPDGGIFKMVKYPKAGFWISYNKIPGTDPMVMIALQKM